MSLRFIAAKSTTLFRSLNDDSILDQHGLSSGIQVRGKSDIYGYDLRLLPPAKEDESRYESKEVLVLISGFTYNSVIQCFGKASREKVENLKISFDDVVSSLQKAEGEFAAVVFDKWNKKVTIVSNKCGTVPIFYSVQAGCLIVTTNLIEHAAILKQLGQEVQISKIASMLYLGQGGMMADETLLENVKRITSGYDVSVDLKTEHCQKNQYYHFCRHSNIKEKDALDALDESFRNAVRKQYELDSLVNKNHFGMLSGGLDSRLDAVVAYEEGFQARTNFTFGEPMCPDIRIAEDIACSLNQPHITVSLTGGNFICDWLKPAVLMNGGVSIAAGSVHAAYAISCINPKGYGVMHTGQLGDGVLGSLLNKADDSEPDAQAGSYGDLFQEQCLDYRLQIAKNYEHHEMFMLYTRGFLTANGGYAMIRNNMYPVSPFLDTDFINTCYSIHPKLRYGNKIYNQWICDKIPMAVQFKWEKTMSKPSAPKYFGRTLGQWWRGTHKILDKMGVKSNKVNRGMNPFDTWYGNNHLLKSYIDNEFQRFRDLGQNVFTQKEWAIVENYYSEARCINKIQIISWLLTINYLKYEI